MKRWLRRVIAWFRFKRNEQWYLELDKAEKEWYDDVEQLTKGDY